MLRNHVCVVYAGAKPEDADSLAEAHDSVKKNTVSNKPQWTLCRAP